MTKQKKAKVEEQPEATITLKLFPNSTSVEIEGAARIRKSRLQRSIRHVFAQLSRERRKLRDTERDGYQKAVSELEEMKNVR